ncbi:MAG: DUF4143 domain-containing protein [Candidatus Methanoplasma sp.]|jgi:predicted AAA+ superfamily ATPase|nr:DUF4143 domain-containing protein [Candidatus Methanoplasma sp.]
MTGLKAFDRAAIRSQYRPRIIDTTISDALSVFGGVNITGCKWCGKTWTGVFHSASSAYIGDKAGRSVAEMSPETALSGDEPRLIDEWQDVPDLWDVARYNMDVRNRKGMYIFTGSSSPPLRSTSHSGTGRFATVKMRPMSLFESGDSTGSASLSDMIAGKQIKTAKSDMDYPAAIRLMCRGGWPSSMEMRDEDAVKIPMHYENRLIESDISHLDGIKRSPDVMRHLLRSLARNNATAAKVPVLADDMYESTGSVSEQTVRSYLNVLERMFVIEEQPPWYPSLRSRARMRVTPKRHFVDPSLAAAVMNAGPDALIADPNTSGFLFESLCYRDLCAYVAPLNGRVCHYRDNSGLEVDNIIEAGGRWGAIEVKLGHNEVDKAASSLTRLKRKMEGEVPEPAFLAVVTATGGLAYVRDDGISVVPIDCLGP